VAHLQVEMIRGFVEQEQVWTAVHDQRQGETRLLTTRERSDRRFRHIAAKIEAAEEIAQILLARERVGGNEML
jgi:hypothetical protein